MLLPTSRKKNVGWPGEEEAAVSSAEEENMALARRFLEARIKGDLDTVYEMMPPDFVSHTKLLPDQEPTREGQIWATAQLSAAASNRSIRFEDQIAAGYRRRIGETIFAMRDTLFCVKLPWQESTQPGSRAGRRSRDKRWP
jgi:hypothetical protein